MREGEKKRVWVPASRPTELEWGIWSERGQYPWVFELELVKVEDTVPWWVFAILASPILAGELYIQLTGKLPGDALNDYLYDLETSTKKTDTGHTKVSKRSLTEVVEATLRCAAGDCRRSEDAKVAQEVSSPGIGRVLLCWRGERRKLLKAAATQWQVEDLIAEIED
eukprot:g3279.t1